MSVSRATDHCTYTSAPHYPPIRRSARNLYMAPDTMAHASLYNTATSVLQPEYGLDLSSYPPALPTSNSPPSQRSGYIDSFTGLPMPDVVDLEMGPPQMEVDLSILSAVEHRDTRLLEERIRRPPVRSDPDHSKDAGSGERRRRHRSAQSDNSIVTPGKKPSGVKKQRGRPRLDPKDESAADRRRTQIRLAQRAYRLRKETTITSLRTRVEELENVIEGMQKVFFELQASSEECMRKLDTHSERESFGEAIRSLTERFLALAKTAAETGESPGEEDASDARQQCNRIDRPRSGDDESSATGGSTENLPMWGGYQLNDAREGPHEDTYTCTDNALTSRGIPDGVRQDQRPSNNLFDPQNAEVFPLFASPTPPISYSFQEAPFARRLHRACLERAYTLLSSPSVANEKELQKVFEYTFCYATRDDAFHTVQTMIKPGALETLTSDECPQNVPNGTIETLRRAKEEHRELTKLGIAGKYLIPSDVERILVEKGLLETYDTSDSEHGSSPASSQDFGYLPSGDSSTDAETQFQGGSPTKLGGIEEIPRSRPIIEGVKNTVDLDLLLKELLPRGVCLGRYPGFKKADVDACLVIASRRQMVF